MEGETKPHFAAARRMAWQTAVPVTAALTTAAPVVASVTDEPALPKAVAASAASLAPEARAEAETDFTAALLAVSLPASSPAPAPVAAVAFVEVIPLGPDVEAVENVLPGLTRDYPQILPWLQKLQHAVVEASRESSLALAG